MKQLVRFSLTCAILLTARSLLAVPALDIPLPGGFLDVQYDSGAGTNSASFIVDFGDNGGGTYAFRYRWPSNVMPTPVQALYSLINATGPAGSLSMAVGPAFGPSGPDPQVNYFVNGFSYGADSHSPNPATKSWFLFLGNYSNSQVTWGNPNDVFFGISGIDLNGNIIYTLQDKGFYGFHVGGFDANFMIVSDNPRLPIAVPEPATRVLAGAGFIFVLARWRTKSARRRVR